MAAPASLIRRGSSRVGVTFLLVVAGLIVAAPAVQAAPPPPATWLDVEVRYLELLNCTRTGGWVMEDGTCADYGTGVHSAYRKPLARAAKLSRMIARPYAKTIATRAQCLHNLGGDLGKRMRKHGFDGAYGENIACRYSGDPMTAIVKAHLAFQSEQSSAGGHWANLKNKSWKSVGIGVWVVEGGLYLTTDFYAP